MNTSSVLIAFLMTSIAGLATGIGSAMAFFSKRTNKKLLSMALGFSAGVMIYVSFMELMPQGQAGIAKYGYKAAAPWLAMAGFFGGILLIAIIDYLIPEFENPHETALIEDLYNEELKENILESTQNQKLMRMSLFSALAIAIHNFPEGLATFAAALQNPEVGISVTFAIALHNIPEGIAVSIPLYYATGSKKKSFILGTLSGLAEPLGALIGFIFLFQFFNSFVIGILLSMVAGIMVFISLDELLPSAQRYGAHHWSIYSMIAGMLIMAISLNIL